MAKLIIADEVNPSYTADVLAGGALEAIPVYSYTYLASSCATGVISASPCLLHSIIVSNTATGVLVLSDQADTASGNPLTTSASAIATIYTDRRGSYVFDLLTGGALCYRLSGADAVADEGVKGITITYQVV
jgi:hypothetical protein